MADDDAIVNSLAAAAREDGISVGVAEGCLTVPDIDHALALVAFARNDGWAIDGNNLVCHDPPLAVPVVLVSS